MSFRITIPEFNSNKLQNIPVSDTTPLENQVLQFSQNQWNPATLTPGSEGPSISPYIVGSGEDDYTTIAEAIAAAVVDGASAANRKNIYLKPGTYTENLAIPDGINLIGFNSNAITLGINVISDVNAVQIIGSLTLAASALVSLTSLTLTSEGVSITTEGGTTLQIVNCLISSTGLVYSQVAGDATTVYINSSQITAGGLAALVDVTNSLTIGIAFSKVTSGGVSPCAAGISLDVQASFVRFSPVSQGVANIVAINASNFISADGVTFINFNNAASLNILNVKNSTGISGTLTATTTSGFNSSYTFSNCYGIPTFALNPGNPLTLEISNCYDTTRAEIVNKFLSSNDDIFMNNFVYTGGAHLQTIAPSIATVLATIPVSVTSAMMVQGIVCGKDLDANNSTCAHFSAACKSIAGAAFVGAPTITLYADTTGTVTLDVSGGDMRIVVTAPPPGAYYWSCTYTIQYVNNA